MNARQLIESQLVESTDYYPLSGAAKFGKLKKLSLKKHGVELYYNDDKYYALTDGQNYLWLDFDLDKLRDNTGRWIFPDRAKVTCGTRYGASDVSELINWIGFEVADEHECMELEMEREEKEEREREEKAARRDTSDFKKDLDDLVNDG